MPTSLTVPLSEKSYYKIFNWVNLFFIGDTIEPKEKKE